MPGMQDFMPKETDSLTVAARVDAADVPHHLLDMLARALSASALPGEADGFGGDALADAAQFLARAALHRAAGTTVVLLEPLPGDGPNRRMRLALINDDMPFLVDSASLLVSGEGLAVERILHPVLTVRRDVDGNLTGLSIEKESGERRESMIYLELERADARARRRLTAALEAGMADVRAAVRDWPALQAAMRANADGLQDGEAAALLRWFVDGSMTQLGHLVIDRAGGARDPIGICAGGSEPLLSQTALDAAFAWFDRGGRVPLLVKSNRLSSVHRRVLLDLAILPIRDGAELTHLSIHAGLWTSAALSSPPAKVPMLRMQLAQLMDKYGFDPSGHAGKALVHALTALPHDLLIAFSPAALEQLALTAMSITDRPRPKLVTAVDALERHLFAFVWLPRDEVSTGRRLAIEAMLADAARAKVLGWSIAMEDGGAALLRYTLDLRGGGMVPDTAALDDRLKQMVRGWVPEVEAALGAHGEEGRAAVLAQRFGALLPAHYRNQYSPEEAARDILRLRDLTAEAPRSVRLVANAGDAAGQLGLKVYNHDGALALSDVVPVLEHFGFTVLEEMPTELARPEGESAAIHIHDFLLALPQQVDRSAVAARADIIERAVRAVLDGKAENDAFNQLLITSSIEPRAIVWLRAWFRYLRQTGMAFGMDTVVAALRGAPSIMLGLVARFKWLNDPSAQDDAAAAAEQQAIDAAFAHVSGIDDDRILRLFGAVIDATLRTNAFAPAAREALAFKIDSARVPGLPKPLPWREIFVYSPRVEGIHLRSGPVARGGLRWSDRRDDFRTEILGLMKAQRVKNAVIVPTGAKGGFYPKALPDMAADRDAWFAEGTECYRIFIRALLSVTDNLVAGKVVHPDAVHIRDGEDPYFVVAADKGTATFSDVANALAMERDFWLGDAFASGGSKGYDHKAMGITAKGAWVSVQRHFAEMGVDVQRDSISVAGCGDMSGDVFGNGMLLSKAIRLVAAFDHRHIFFDPDPDPAASWAERSRMFNLPRSSWADYDAALISKGGGVFPRSQKSIPLSAPVQAMLGLDVAEADPATIISAILRAQVDLIWFGGIGTYVKAAAQNNADVGDPANDRLRVNAEELRCKAIGEGANLGMTQAARIAFAARGGRVNTDFIDNSAGVDCSDNEVNIKIALNREMAEGRLAQDDRDALLLAMTDDVGALVLEDNRLQALALSIAEQGGAAAVPSTLRLIEGFEATGRLDRQVEGLAANDELQRRAQDGHGLYRPELAVLLSTAKLALQDAIEVSPLAEDAALGSDLAAAFPRAMQDRFAGAIAAHQLRREIVATKLANRIVNRLGIIHPFELIEEEGCAPADMAAAFAVAERLFAMPDLWARLDTAAVSETTRLALFAHAAAGMTSQMADILRIAPAGTSPAVLVDGLRPGVERLTETLDALLSDTVRQQWDQLAARLVDGGAPADLTDAVTRLFKLDGVIGLADLAARRGAEVIDATRAFTRLGEALGLDWAQTLAARMSPADPWERLLVNSLARDFQQMRLDFLARLDAARLAAGVEDWLAGQAGRITMFRSTVDRARTIANPNGAMLSHLAGQARNLLLR